MIDTKILFEAWHYVLALAAVSVGFTLSYLAKRVAFRNLTKVLPKHVANLIAKAILYLGILVTIIVAAGLAGLNLVGLALAGGIVGIVLGFGLQPLIANLFAGILVMSEKVVKLGDFVEVEGVKGYVTDISIIATTIQSLDGYMVKIPNSKIMQSTVINYSRSSILRLEFVVSIAYREDAVKAYDVISRVVESHPLVLEEPPPEIFVSNLGSSGVDITVRVWVPTQCWYEVKMDLLWKIKKALSDAGIEIPFTQIDVWLRTPLQVKLGYESEVHRKG